MFPHINIKLGSRCNLCCKYCHSIIKPDVSFNPKVISYIKTTGIRDVCFLGGEPLLYMDQIKSIVDALGDEYRYHVTTNATLLTPTIATYFNEHNTSVTFSVDGDESTRECLHVNLQAIQSLIHPAFISATVYPENAHFDVLWDSLLRAAWKLKVADSTSIGVFPHLAHKTINNPNLDLTDDVVDAYIDIAKRWLKQEYMMFIGHNRPLEESKALQVAVQWYCDYQPVQGVRCCNQYTHTITMDGNILLCPYLDTVVGDTSGIDQAVLTRYIPDKCKDCELVPICKTLCVASITDAECKVIRAMHPYIRHLLLG